MAVSLFKVMQYNDLCNISDQSLTTTTHCHPEQSGGDLLISDYKKIPHPVEIAAVIVWQVEDTAKAVFQVDDYNKYVSIQSEAAVRHLADICPYDNFEEERNDSIES